jgi:hypothetical protein
MGFLLKILLFGVAVYGAYRTFRHWKGLFDRFTGNANPPQRPPAPPPQTAQQAPPPPVPPSRKPAVIEDTVQCAGCGAYISTSAEKCGQCGRPRP